MIASTTTLITGAASGLGWSLARTAFAHGHSGILVDRDADALAEKHAELAAEEANRVRHFTVELTDGPARDRLTALLTAVTASSCPTTRSLIRASMWTSLSFSPSSIRDTGIPVHWWTTRAMSSSSTSSFSMT